MITTRPKIYVRPGTFLDFAEDLKRGERITRNWWNDKRYLRFVDGTLMHADAHWHRDYWLKDYDKVEPLNLQLFQFEQFAHLDWMPWLLTEKGTLVLPEFSVDSTAHCDVTDLFDIFTDHFRIHNNRIYLR